MKIFDRKDVFSWSNAEEAKQYIGKQGYFANTMTQLRDSINKNEVYILCKIFEDVGNCFYTTESSHSIGYDFFLPVDKVKEIEEKKYRPFKDFEELSETLNKGVGSEIIYRIKKFPLRKITTSIMGYITEDNREDLIILGIGTLPLSTYFEEIEIWNNVEKQWQSFGVLDES